MGNTDKSLLKKQLDNTIMQITEMIRADIYQNVIVATVKDWFEGNDSISSLNGQIQRNVKKRWPFIEKKI